MNAVFVLLPGITSLGSIASAVRVAGLRAGAAPGGRLRVADDQEHVWVFLETDPHEAPREFEAELGPNGSAPHGVLVIDYSSLPLLHRVLNVIADRPDATVNNDHGTTLPGNEFVARMAADPTWDWRRRSDRASGHPPC